jgi:hypothetical protein
VRVVGGGQVALINQCLPQTDTFMKAAISLVPEAPAYDTVENNRRAPNEARLAGRPPRHEFTVKGWGGLTA